MIGMLKGKYCCACARLLHHTHGKQQFRHTDRAAAFLRAALNAEGIRAPLRAVSLNEPHPGVDQAAPVAAQAVQPCTKGDALMRIVGNVAPSTGRFGKQDVVLRILFQRLIKRFIVQEVFQRAAMVAVAGVLRGVVHVTVDDIAAPFRGLLDKRIHIGDAAVSLTDTGIVVFREDNTHHILILLIDAVQPVQIQERPCVGVGNHQEERNVVFLRLGNAVKIPLLVCFAALDCSAGMDQDRMVNGLIACLDGRALPACCVRPGQCGPETLNALAALQRACKTIRRIPFSIIFVKAVQEQRIILIDRHTQRTRIQRTDRKRNSLL